MDPNNPYTPPKASIADSGGTTADSIERLNRIAACQRMAIMALVCSIGAQVLMRTAGPLGGVVLIASFVFSVVSVVRLAGALGSAGGTQTLYAIGLIVPLINIAILLMLSSRATKRLRAGGYSVGLFGAGARGT